MLRRREKGSRRGNGGNPKIEDAMVKSLKLAQRLQCLAIKRARSTLPLRLQLQGGGKSE